MYGMSRVYPLPSALRKKIIDLFCPAHLRNNPSITARKSHLARILLGRPIPDPGRVAPQRFFDTYNFPLTRDRAELLGIDVVNTAVEMGRLLAQMHMKAKNDARDIEIVLGANITNNSTRYHREPRIWVIDFNQVAHSIAPKGRFLVSLKPFLLTKLTSPARVPVTSCISSFPRHTLQSAKKLTMWR